ncbi:MAG: response regulator transcription factor [Lewinella sp.]|nr:response regulator transcription factor [Lewinella sp.]
MKSKGLQLLIVDDEVAARSKIQRYLNNVRETFTLAREAANVDDAFAILQEQDTDLIFLDIQMPGQNGFDLIRLVGVERMPPVIFVTAYDQYALRAFEVQAVDYLLKPFDEERFRTAYFRAVSQMHREKDWPQLFKKLLADRQEKPTYLQRLTVNIGSRFFLLQVEEIEVFTAEDKYVRIHAAGKQYLIRETLSQLEQQLDPAHFARIHRSCLVNLNAVAQMTHRSHGDYLLQMNNGMEVIMSRRYRENVFGGK